MLKSPSASKFEAVRAKWETKQQDESPTKPLLAGSKSTQSEKPSIALPSRLASLTKFNNPFKSKGFNRRQTTGEVSSSLLTGNRDSSNRTVPLASPLTAMQAACAQPALVRSKTTSLLPVPTKRATTFLTKQPASVQSQTPAVFQSRIPTPPASKRTSFLVRSSTQPNLIASTGRKASEFSRRGSTKWAFAEETRPLLEAQEEDYFTPRPQRFHAGSSDEYLDESPSWRTNIPPRIDSLPKLQPFLSKDKENIYTQSATDSPNIGMQNRHSHVIQCHTLLQPIQPLSPPVASVPGAFPETSPTASTFGSEESIPMLVKRKSLSRPPLLHLSSFKHVNTAKPSAYWSGRFSSLHDRLLNEAFDIDDRVTSPSDADSTSSSTTSLIKCTTTGTGARALRIFQLLDNSCVSDDARRSLLLFRNMYAIRNRMPFLKVEIPPSPGEERDEGELADMEAGTGTSMGAIRKMSFMERLRGRKSSGKSLRE